MVGGYIYIIHIACDVLMHSLLVTTSTPFHNTELFICTYF